MYNSQLLLTISMVKKAFKELKDMVKFSLFLPKDQVLSSKILMEAQKNPIHPVQRLWKLQVSRRGTCLPEWGGQKLLLQPCRGTWSLLNFLMNVLHRWQGFNSVCMLGGRVALDTNDSRRLAWWQNLLSFYWWVLTAVSKSSVLAWCICWKNGHHG